MNSTIAESALALTLDIGRYRIRIHRSTLQQMGNPDYFRLLVNPQEKGIVLEGCSEKCAGAFPTIRKDDRKHSMEVYCPALVSEISKCAGFQRYRSVKLLGRQICGQHAVFFRLVPADACLYSL